jgi:hypothetical protein
MDSAEGGLESRGCTAYVCTPPPRSARFVVGDILHRAARDWACLKAIGIRDPCPFSVPLLALVGFRVRRAKGLHTAGSRGYRTGRRPSTGKKSSARQKKDRPAVPGFTRQTPDPDSGGRGCALSNMDRQAVPLEARNAQPVLQPTQSGPS